ncbi:ribose-phosphate pyrophosphokinase [Ramlibacter sp.]|uniref:ribose-phosphate pyrophosphokinase n=1 Tax=Ramlibacter sp. TaxID=1917967 RepID=UPI002B9B09BC|nr:ribose-phosphate pyrophosphokinase [Ramlibacter sp.]HWI81149.1 ribose-phosphate pyrophosphokinase [Ramlibacter sp.]
MSTPGLLIVALPDGGRLPGLLAADLGCERSELALHRFPDGESLVRFDLPLQGRCVVLAGSLDHPDTKALPLLFAADAARELGAARVGLVAPYLGYMRQDARFRPGEAVTSRSFARLLSSSLDFLVTVDPHLHRWRSLSDIYSIRTSVVAAAPLIARWLRRHVPEPVLVGPDAESEQWVASVARLAGAPWAVMAKARRGDHDVSVALRGGGQWTGRIPVLLDDIASTGETLAAAARVLERMGLPRPVCVVVHALLTPQGQAKLLDAGVARMVSCDTIAHPTNAIEVAPLLAQAVRDVTAATG